jgi:hypothetical protein
MPSLPLPDDKVDVLKDPEVKEWCKTKLHVFPHLDFGDEGYRLVFASDQDAVKFALMWDFVSS